jgi:hypothetical protein
MIPYADFERAVSSWKIRQSGGHAPAAEEASGAVVAEVAVPNAETSYEAEDPDRTPLPEAVSNLFPLPTDEE